jgi:class 3 adenylate cyclase
MPRRMAKVKTPPGFKLQHTVQVKSGLINQIAWSPDGLMYAFTMTEGDTWLCDGKTGELCYPFHGHSNNVRCVGWSPDGQHLATGSDDKSIIIWDSYTLRSIRKLRDQLSSVYSLAWSPNYQTLAAGLEDGYIMLWDCGTWRGQNIFDAHTAKVTSLAWSPDGNVLASGSPADSKICLWGLDNGRQRWKPLEDDSFVHSLAWSPNGKIIASGLADKTIKLWDAAKRKPLPVLKGHRSDVIGVCFSADGRLLASKSLDRSVRLWRCDTWEMVAKLDEPSYFSAGLAFSPQGASLATLGHEQRIINVWDLDFNVLLPRKEEQESLVAWAGDPQATLAVVFTDIVGSTAISGKFGDEIMDRILTAHYEQARLLIKENRGREVKTEGDSFMVIFRTAVDALNFILALYEKTGDERVKIRAATHVASVRVEEKDIKGRMINYTKRVLGKAKGAEIWLSERAYEDIKQESAKNHERLTWTKHPDCELDGFSERYSLWSVTVN